MWAFWGSIEAFHEGWYHHSFWQNLALTSGQYLMPMLLFLVPGLICLRFPRTGGLLHMTTGILLPLLLVRTPAAIIFKSLMKRTVITLSSRSKKPTVNQFQFS